MILSLILKLTMNQTGGGRFLQKILDYKPGGLCSQEARPCHQ